MKKRLLSLGMSVTLFGMLFGCGSSSTTPSQSEATTAESSTTSTETDSTTSGSDTKLTYAFLPNTQNNTFQSSMNDMFKQRCDEAGITYVCLDPDYDLNKQLNQIQDVANQKVDMVFVIPVDSQGIRQGLDELNKKGIPVINVDTAIVEEDRELVRSVIGTDAVMAGKLVGEQMVKDYPDGAKIAILDFPENESCVQRVEGFMAGLGDSQDKFTIVAQQNGAAALDASMPIAEDIITSNPDIQAFFCINDPSSLGAVAAIKSSGKTDIGVYSIDASPEGKAALVDGSFTAVSAQVPIEIANTAFDKATEVLAGTEIDKEIWLPSHLVSKEEAEETAGQWQ